MDVLGVFPHTHTHTHKHQGGHMRNATFPGIKISTVMKLSLSLHSPPVHTRVVELYKRLRNLHCLSLGNYNINYYYYYNCV
ncbi:hypothetical protein Pcinc_021163 [Petrolisthes cinctipes]|uniref:Uncharacterized protein n=1 Tax=Petrolisthes cinctipes TaxID=88211 RepID=A0AAE1FIS4_PETCI|nr:hypothetical protein Pcinc_021163 [Petrolisthes cinctipes]